MPNSVLSWSKLALAAVSTLALAACESSQRLGSFLPGSTVRAASPAAPAPLTAAPGSDADTEELPPPPGSGGQVAALPPPVQAPPPRRAFRKRLRRPVLHRAVSRPRRAICRRPARRRLLLPLRPRPPWPPRAPASPATGR